jgi:hypothetical protein
MVPLSQHVDGDGKIARTFSVPPSSGNEMPIKAIHGLVEDTAPTILGPAIAAMTPVLLAMDMVVRRCMTARRCMTVRNCMTVRRCMIGAA